MSDETPTADRVAVVVVGDLGRSPRMQAHALALANRGVHVDLVGYDGTPVYPEIQANPRIQVHALRLPKPLARIPDSRLLYIVTATLKLLTQSLQLLWALLFRISRPSALLVQNPPFLPTLPLAWLAARLHRCRLVVDWHNLGWLLLAERLGALHPIVRALALLERKSGPMADAHFCVSMAMRDRLAEESGIRASRVLYDRPLGYFERPNAAERRDRLRELGRRLRVPAMQRDNVPVIVCPTSWTADEDFDLLLTGIEQFDAMLASRASMASASAPRALFLLTGLGELRTRYESRISSLSLRSIQVTTAWLTHRDYRGLLASADLGLCLHRSVSGVDLPYKVSEMFGAGLPIGVFDYGPVIEECCTPGVDCFTFSSAEDLGRCLHQLLTGYPPGADELRRLRESVSGTPGWQETWDHVAWDAFGLSE